MSKRNKENFIKKNSDLGIKVGDWFEEINPDSEIKTFFKVRSIEGGEIGFIIIPLKTRYSVDYCSLDIDNEGWILSRFQRDGKDKLKFKKYHSEQYITFQRRDEKFVLDQLLEDLRIGFILECFGVDKKKVISQNLSSTQSANKSKTAKDLDIKVGDWLKGTRYFLDLKSIFFVSKIETDSIFLENVSPRNIRFDQSIESEPWNKTNFYREEGKVYFKSEDLFIEFEKISKEDVLDTLRSWSTTIDWTFKRLMLIPNSNKKLMTIENFLERGKDFSGKCIIVKPISGRVATCIKVNRVKRGDEVYMNVSHSSIVFYPEIAFDIPIDSKNSCHCRTEKDYPAEKELLYDTHTLIDVISEEEFMALRNEISSKNSAINNDHKDTNGLLGKSEDTPRIEKLKNCRYLKYNKDNKTYYLRYPRFEEREINGQKIFFVPADNGVTIIDNQIHYYNFIRLVFENQSEFFNNATEIDEYEFHNICELLD